MISDDKFNDLMSLLNVVLDMLIRQDRKLDKMATQAELDAATQALTDLGTAVQSAITQLQSDVSNLQNVASQPELDATALDAAVAAVANTTANLNSEVSDVTALVPGSAASTPTAPVTPSA